MVPPTFGTIEKTKRKCRELDRILETAKEVAEDLLIKQEDLEKEEKVTKKLTRGTIRRLKNNNKDAEEGKYEEREISAT